MKTYTLDYLLERYSQPIQREDSRGKWKRTFLNGTYLELALEFPQDYLIGNK